jgi:signal transduction histidine kinase/DNA-binding response OmpR family regulator
MKSWLYLFILSLLLPACDRKTGNKPATSVYETINAVEEPFILISPDGDTIPTGEPIPARGKWINPDSVSKPKTIPLRRQPKVVQAHPNVHPVGTPRVVPISEKPTVITPGEDDVPLPDTVPARGKVVPVKQPKPVPALPPQMKEGARYDIQYLDVDQGMISSYVNSILEDSRGNLWFGTDGGGVSRFDGRCFTHFTEEEGLTNIFVWSILEDSQCNMWFGTNGRGVSRYDPDNGRGSFTHFNMEEGLSGTDVYSMLEDNQGNLWFGTGGGVSRYERDAPTTDGEDRGSFTHFTKEQGLSGRAVFSMLKDSQGNLWFGTDGGLNRYDPPDNYRDHRGRGSFTHYTTKAGLSDNSVFSILEDGMKNIWISTQKGITLLIPHLNESSSAGDSEGIDYQFFTFGKEDGLKRTDFERNSACVDHNNRIWWGSISGLTMLDLNKFELPTDTPRIRLEHIEVKQAFIDYRGLADTSYRHTLPFGKALSHSFDSVVPFYNYPVTMTLPYDLNHLTFHFSAIDWAAPHKIKYSYLMEGLDEDWSIPQSEPKADYRNLPDSTFTLKVKAVGAAQKWSKPFEYTFTVRPPWWLTVWAYAFYGLIIASLLYTLYRFLLNRRLQLAETHRLRELDQVKTKLYTNITHEFRTPLTVILGMVDQLKDQAGEATKEGLKMIRRNGRQLLNLVNQLLDLRKLESGTMPVRMMQGDILLYLKYILESFHSYCASKEIRLHFLTGLKELNMDYDPEKILTILSNLLSNAIKFTPEGGDVYLQLAVGSWQSAGDQLPTGNCLLLTVKDTGIGIPEEKLPHIFDRFYQVDDEATRRAEGTGIGLALTRELVKLLGGSITVKSTIGEGTEFTVDLPVTQTAASLTEAVDSQSVKSQVTLFVPALPEKVEGNPLAEEDEERPLALIIEDNKDVVSYLTGCLEKEYVLQVAYNGQQGIDKAIEIIPDIIISDVMMPEKDGFEVCQTLKNDERTSHIPIIMLTAKADITSKIEGLERGADAYLAKPFHKEELLVRIKKLLELRKKLWQYYRSLAISESKELKIPTGLEVENAENAFVSKVCEIVEGHLMDIEFNVKKLCREVGLSNSQLNRKISALTGYPAKRFIRHIRLSHAKVMLVNTDETITAVAFDNGFSDPDYFSRVFRKEFGLTPTEFRDQNRI